MTPMHFHAVLLLCTLLSCTSWFSLGSSPVHGQEETAKHEPIEQKPNLAQTPPSGANVAAQDNLVDFERDIRPILEEHCLDCHSGHEAESGLELSSPLETLRGGDSGEPTVVPGDSSTSHLIERLTSSDPSQAMPPDGRLPDELINRLRSWIDEADGWAAAEQELASEESDHWSFLPVQRPTPISSEPHPIDGFVTDRLNAAGLQLSPTAERARLIRRLYLVMHGLLPSDAAVQQFVHDDSTYAWERLVERVLNSPRYGERMATFWLDVVRFGETNGFETNRERPNAYHYRDWVVEAFNGRYALRPVCDVTDCGRCSR
jgi:hypothetical protein